MSQLLKTLTDNLDASTLSQISQQIGANPSQTQSAISAALPMLVGGLARNTQTPEGANALAGALDRDHDGSLLDNLGPMLGSLAGGGGGGGAAGALGALGGLLGGGGGGGGAGSLLGMAASMLGGAPGNGSGRTVNGAGILGHILGGAQGAVQNNVAQASGLNAGQAGQLLSTLAPMIMGALGRTRQQQGLDAGGLASMLQGESQSLAGGAQNAITSFLDADGDGDMTDDLMKLAGQKLLGGLFGG